MVELIQGSPYLDAFNKGQKRRAVSAAASAGLRRDEQAMEDAEVTRVRAEKYDQTIADLLQKKPGGLRSPVPVAPPVQYASTESIPGTGRNTAAPAKVPMAGAVTPEGGIRSVTPMSFRGIQAQAALNTKGMRAQGASLSADIEAEQEKAEMVQFDKMFEISEKYPQMAVEYARKMGILEKMPLFERILQDQEITMAINAKRDELSKLYKDHPDLYGKAMEQEVQNILRHFAGARQGAGQAGQAAGVQPASTGGRPLAAAAPAVPAGVSDYSEALPALPPSSKSGAVHKNIGYMDFLVNKGIATDYDEAFQLINRAKGDRIARARLVADIFNRMKEDILDDRNEDAKFTAASEFVEKLLQASDGTSGEPEADKYPVAPRDPSQRDVDKIYRSPNGKLAIWTGEGWQLVQ